MKFKLVEKLDERFHNTEVKRYHYDRHGKHFNPPYEDADTYEKEATSLASKWKDAGLARSTKEPFVGYVAQNGHWIVYNRLAKALVIFDLASKKDSRTDEPWIVSYYELSYSSYLNKLENKEDGSGFAKELPHNQIKIEQEKAQAEAEKNKEAAEQEKAKRKARYNKRFNRK